MSKGELKDSVVGQKVTTEDKLNYKTYFIKGGYFDQLLNQFDPVIFFLDFSKIFFSPELFIKKVKFAVLSTKVNLNNDRYIPPFTSSFIPFKTTRLTAITCKLLWSKALLIKKLRYFLEKKKGDGFTLYDLPFDYLKSRKMDMLKSINCRRVAKFGLDNVPEIILSPLEFDYPHRTVKENQIYVGPSVYMERMENIDAEVESFFNRTHLIYCSMGLYDVKYRSIRIDFINKLIRAFSREPKYNVLISCGNDIEIHRGDEVPKNILIRVKMPQMTVLKYSKLMITHGGMQSITESILSNVPVLVYPLNPDLDQKGNAARVKFHGVGIVGNIVTDTPIEIINKVNKLMFNKEIMKSTKHLREKYIKSENFMKGMKFIEEYINDKVDEKTSERARLIGLHKLRPTKAYH